MNFITLKNKIVNAYTYYEYSRTAMELSRRSTRQLTDIGISKQLLSKGASAYPWRLEDVSQEIPNNVTMINTTSLIVTPIASMILKVGQVLKLLLAGVHRSTPRNG